MKTGIHPKYEEVTIKWNFRRDQGAAAVGFERNTGFVVAQAAVNGKTIDVKMDIDATSGKFNNKNHTDWCQVNPGTKFTMPSYKGAVVSLESMNATTTTTIAGEKIRDGEMANFQKEINDLLYADLEVDIKPIPVDWLDDVKLTPQETLILEPFIQFEE